MSDTACAKHCEKTFMASSPCLFKMDVQMRFQDKHVYITQTNTSTSHNYTVYTHVCL